MLIDVLHTELNQTKRDTVKALLVEEENKFGNYSEKLQRVERYIADCQGHIVAQHKVVDRLRSNDGDCGVSERVLANLTELWDIFRAYRPILLDGLDRAQI